MTNIKSVLFIALEYFTGTRVSKYQDVIKSQENWTFEKVLDWQNFMFKKLFTYHYNENGIYRFFLEEKNINISAIKTIEDLNCLPTIGKSDIINLNNRFDLTKSFKGNFFISSTGGSTGNPLRFPLDYNSYSYITANTFFNRIKAGYNFGDKFVTVGSKSLLPGGSSLKLKHRVYYWLIGKVPISGINLNEQIIREHIDLIKEQKIKFIYGYASSLYLIGKYALDNDIRLDLTAVFTTSEMLTSNYYDTIKKAFGCHIIDEYGALDGGVTAFKHNDGLFKVGYNSLITDSNEHNNGITQVLATDLLNYACPLINYEVGDEVENLQRGGSTYNGQWFKKVLGRSLDVIKLENGNVLTGPGFTVLFKDLNVVAYRIKKIKAMHILIEIKKGINYTQIEEDLIRNTFQKHAGTDANIEIVYKETFSELNNGKRDFFLT